MWLRCNGREGGRRKEGHIYVLLLIEGGEIEAGQGESRASPVSSSRHLLR